MISHIIYAFDTIYDITQVNVFSHRWVSVFIGQLFLFCYLIGWYISDVIT